MPTHRRDDATGIRPLAMAFASFFPGLNAIASTANSAAALESSSGGLAQAALGLAVVLATIVAIAWLLKRFSGTRGNRSALIRIIGGAAIGQRERVVLIEVDETWLLVGVAPGQVRTLHCMPKRPEGDDTVSDASPQAERSFHGWLRRMTEKRNHA